MGYFVEMVVNDFTQVNKHVLLDLNLGIFVNLNSGGVDNTQTIINCDSHSFLSLGI